MQIQLVEWAWELQEWPRKETKCNRVFCVSPFVGDSWNIITWLFFLLFWRRYWEKRFQLEGFFLFLLEISGRDMKGWDSILFVLEICFSFFLEKRVLVFVVVFGIHFLFRWPTLLSIFGCAELRKKGICISTSTDIDSHHHFMWPYLMHFEI